MAATSIILFALVICFRGSSAAVFTVENRCLETIWPGIQDNTRSPPMSGGFRLNSGESVVVDVPGVWSAGRFWARTGCAFNASGTNGHCATRDCGGLLHCSGIGGEPPVSLAEFTLGSTPQDIYDVSLVDGFNIPVSIFPSGGSGNCSSVSCTADLNQLCPEELRVRGDGGIVVACRNACLAFNEDRYCCRGDYNTPQRCPPNRYSEVFKKACPAAYSYAFDDTTSTFTCTGADYSVIFC